MRGSHRMSRRGAIALTLTAAVWALAAAAPTEAPLPRERPSGPVTKAAGPASAPERTGAAIAADIGPTGNYGWLVVDLESGAVVESKDAARAYAPASVAKLPTAFYAIDTLGRDFRFETTVVASGPVENGTLKGTLALVGTGDPELDTDALQPLAEQAHAAGIQRVEGAFVVDASAGPRIAELEPGQPEDVTYNPSLSGLNLNYNRVRLAWDAGKGDDGISMTAMGERLNPTVAGFRVSVDGTPNAPVFDHSFEPGGELWHMASRAFRGKGSRWLPVRRPEIYAGRVFRDLAAKAGLTLPPAEEATAPADARVLGTHQGRPLPRVLRDMLKYSTNLTAEAVGLRSSAAITGTTPETLVASARTMNDWAAQVAGFPKNDPGFRFFNHSGLSTLSRASPQRMVELLKAIAARPPAAESPDPRVPGALSALLKEHNIKDKSAPSFPYAKTHVAAKTGTMNYVRGLSGFIRTPKGKTLAFAYFANDLARRDASGGGTDRTWLARARNLERALIRHWVMLADNG